MKKYPKFLLWFITMGLIFIGCTNDDNIIPDKQEEVKEVETVKLESEINDFVWSALNEWYFWQGEVPLLADDRFKDDNEYFTYLNDFSSPEEIFRNLRSPEDRFSWIVDDYDDLFKTFSGVFKTNGTEFSLTRPPEGGNKVIGVVTYVVKGSDADAKGVKRGDIFYAVDGTQLIAETDANGEIISSNFEILDTDTATFNFAELSEDKTTTLPNDINIELTRSEITENPIHINKTIEVNGTKIGYLMYNQFVNDFNDELNDAFGGLKSSGVTELVLDLRYNSGGSSFSAVLLSSLITGQFTGDVLGRDVWNDKWNAVFGEEEYFIDTLNGAPLNSLNLNKVYILTTSRSASASESVINNLAPHIEVVHIGDATRGKNQLSVTLIDNPDVVFRAENEPDFPLPFRVLNEQSIQNANPTHKYALQPIVGRFENSAGFFDFTDGLQPDIVQLERLFDLGQLGEQGEPLFDVAIQQITGQTAKSLQIEVPENMKIRIIGSSNRWKPYCEVFNYDIKK